MLRPVKVFVVKTRFRYNRQNITITATGTASDISTQQGISRGVEKYRTALCERQCGAGQYFSIASVTIDGTMFRHLSTSDHSPDQSPPP